jgi:hypothetical protein
MKLIWLTAIFSLTTLPAVCDSISITVDAVQPGGVVILEPTGNPLLQPSFCLPICFIEFEMTVPNPSTPTVYMFSSTLTLGGQALPAPFPFTETCTPQGFDGGECGLDPSFFIPNCCKGLIEDGTFTATVNGISKTVHFQLQEVNPNVIPEPATICLFGTGLVAIGWKRFRRQPMRKS